MKCPMCKCNTKTLESRQHEKGTRRRRECEKCFYRWNTYEVSETMLNFYEEQLKRLYKLEQFQLASSVYKGGTGKARGTAWTKSETDRLLTMYYDQHSLKEIAEALNRSHMSIRKRLQYLRKKGKLAI